MTDDPQSPTLHATVAHLRTQVHQLTLALADCQDERARLRAECHGLRGQLNALTLEREAARLGMG